MQLLLCSSAANILFLNTWNSKSHALTMKPLAERFPNSSYTNLPTPEEMAVLIGPDDGANLFEHALTTSIPPTPAFFQTLQSLESFICSTFLSDECKIICGRYSEASKASSKLAMKGHNVSIYSMNRKSFGSLGKGVQNLETILPRSCEPYRDYMSYITTTYLKIVDSFTVFECKTEEMKTADQGNMAKVFWFLEMTPAIFGDPHIIGLQYLQHSLNDKIFQRVLNTSYDLVVLDELFATSQGAIALYMQKHYDTKIAVFSTTDFSSGSSMYRGFGRNPVISPSYYTKTYDVMEFDATRFVGRLLTIKDVVTEQYIINMVSNKWLQKAGDLLGVRNSYKIIYEAASGTFTDFPSRYGFPSAQSRDLINVAEYCQDSNPLSSDLRQFVEDPSSKGTIYVAFGSIVNWIVAPPEVISTFFDVFNSFSDYRIIFSYDGPMIESVKSHIRILSWAPQNDILAHKNTVLFFTHGGLKSIKEGICSSIPMLFLPFFADQPRNSLIARYLNIAEVISKKNITREELTQKINKVLQTHKFASQVRKLNKQFLDTVIEPLEYGTKWAERMIRISVVQSKMYRNFGRLVSWNSFLYIDCIVALLLISGLLIK
ncbi:UDP-glucoronosyl and UDP-glucosyl transferase [Dictyocaulus viviparus]|uniref:glucuronosyltransferase n=1 Tax=Dictyocaulus viviparus TaxID=29172 RepID=A0A0D8Y680_DICVI|nr:UDP-glucoronosyl and UDP-glucosyl transferase [Dictyocaulus viviparus]